MAIFSYIPDRPAIETSTPRVDIVSIGGYEQRNIQGINPFRDSWDLTFGSRSAADAADIIDFLSARGGREPFEWETPFGETGQFIAIDWQVNLDSCNLKTITTKFDLTYLPNETNVSTPELSSSIFTWIPDFVANFERKSNTSQIFFGDGYSQRVVKGFNPQSETWNLEFKNRSNLERDEIRGFLRGARGKTAFSWTDPLTNSINKFICNEWTTTFNNFNNNTISVAFQRRFEP